MRPRRRSSIEMRTRFGGHGREYIAYIRRASAPGMPMRAISPASSVVRGDDAREVEPLVDRVVVAADRAEAVEGRDAQRRGRVGVRRAAGGGVAQREAELRGDRRRPAPPAAPDASVFSIGGWPAIRRRSTATPSHRRRRRRGARPRRRRRRRRRRWRRAGRPASSQRSATTFGRVPPWMTPALTVTVGQRPLSAWRASDLVRGLEDRASGPSPARRRHAPPARGCVEVVVGDALPRADDVAVGARALEDQDGVVLRRERADDRGAERRADLLVRVGDERDRRPRAGLLERGDRVEAGEQARLHVGHAGPGARGRRRPERPLPRPCRDRRRCPCGR